MRRVLYLLLICGGLAAPGPGVHWHSGSIVKGPDPAGVRGALRGSTVNHDITMYHLENE